MLGRMCASNLHASSKKKTFANESYSQLLERVVQAEIFLGEEPANRGVYRQVLHNL